MAGGVDWLSVWLTGLLPPRHPGIGTAILTGRTGRASRSGVIRDARPTADGDFGDRHLAPPP